MPGEFGDDLHRDAVLGLRAAEQLLAIEAWTFGEVREEIGLERREMIGGHGDVRLAPPDGVGGLGVLNDELVLGAAPRVLARLDDKRAVLGEPAFAVAHRVLDQRRRAPVFGHLRLRLDAVAAEHNLGHLLRLSLPDSVLAYLCNA